MKYWKANKHLYGIGRESIDNLLSHMDIMVIKEMFPEDDFERISDWVEEKEERNKL